MIRRLFVVSVTMIFLVQGSAYPQAIYYPGQDDTAVHINVTRRETGKSFSAMNLGLFDIPEALRRQIEILWQMVQGGSQFNRFRFDFGPWQNRQEKDSFFLYLANSFQPRQRVMNYFWQPELYPPLRSVLSTSEMNALQNAKEPMPMIGSDVVTAQLIALRKTDTYKSKRAWERKAMEDSIYIDDLFQQFVSQTGLEHVIFEYPLSKVAIPIAPIDLENVQSELNKHAIYRIHLENGFVRCTQRLPSIAEMVRLMSPAPLYDGVTLNDEHIQEILIALGLITRHTIKSIRFQRMMTQFQGKAGNLVNIFKRTDPNRASRLSNEIQKIGQFQNFSNWMKQTMINRLIGWRSNPTMVAFAQRFIPSSKMFRELRSLRFRKLPIATSLAFAGIALALMFDLANAKTISENSSSDGFAQAKTIAAWSKAAFWTTLLWMGRVVKKPWMGSVMNKGRILTFAKYSTAKIAARIATALIVLDTAGPATNREIPRSDELFDMLGLDVQGLIEVIYRKLNPNWAFQEWDQLIKMRGLRTMDTSDKPDETDEDEDRSEETYKVYKLTPDQFNLEAGYILSEHKSPDERKFEFDTLLGRYAKRYLSLVLATLQQAGNINTNIFLFSIQQYGAMFNDIVKTIQAHNQVIQKLIYEIRRFTASAGAFSWSFPKSRWLIFEEKTEEATLANHLMDVAGEIRNGGTYQRIEGCKEKDERKCWQIVSDPNFVPTDLEIEIGEELRSIAVFLKNKNALAD